MKRGHACGRCGGVRRGGGPVALVGVCDLCQTALCGRHAVWDPDGERHLCRKCARTNKITVIKVRG
jgi:hypothetical protein